MKGLTATGKLSTTALALLGSPIANEEPRHVKKKKYIPVSSFIAKINAHFLLELLEGKRFRRLRKFIDNIKIGAEMSLETLRCPSITYREDLWKLRAACS